MNITKDELTKLAKAITECRYCGRKIIFKCGEREGKPEKNSPALDRINNGNELNINDVQIICMECSGMKGSKTHERLIKWCKDVIKRND